MAEFDIGRQCSHPSCNQLDFLPLECPTCKLYFCADHFFYSNHGCSHPQEGHDSCTKLSDDSVPKSFCCFQECESFGTALSPLVQCPICGKKFCMSHRIEADHKCEAIVAADGPHVMQKTRQKVQEILSQNIQSKAFYSKVSVKNAKLAAKVQLMKLKQSAEGNPSIPPAKRIYFRLLHKSKGDNILSKNVFVSDDALVGKLVDVFASVTQIENPNNSSTSTKKLHIFRQIDGQLWSTDLNSSVCGMVSSEQAFNGETLVLEYSEQAESSELTQSQFEYYKKIK